MAIDTAGIPQQIKDLYQNDTQTAKAFRTLLMLGNPTAAFFGGGRLQMTDKRYVDMTIPKLTAKIQQFHKDFTPSGDMTFQADAHPLHHVKDDFDIEPDVFTEEYNSFLEGLNENDRSKWPFVRWYIEEHIKALYQDKELNVDYKGNVSAATPGTPNFGATIGFGKQINIWIAATDLTPIPLTPSSDPETFVGQLQTFVQTVRDSSPEAKAMYRAGEFDSVMLSPQAHERFITGMSTLYNGQYQRVTDALLTTDASEIEMKIPGTNVTTKGFDSMDGSDKIILSPKWNRFGKIKSEMRKDKTLSGLHPGGRKVWVSHDWWTRIGFYLKEYVYTNDQDLAF